MNTIKPCANLAIGIGSVISIIPLISHTKLDELSPYIPQNTKQNINQYWLNVGNHIQNSLIQAKGNNEQSS